jgi:hypothetical protein
MVYKILVVLGIGLCIVILKWFEVKSWNKQKRK